MPNFDQLKHRAVRDLAWALLRPSFFTQLQEAPSSWLDAPWQDKDLLPWLSALDQNPESLSKHLKDQRATRLGIYFEQLLSFFFDQYPRFQLIAKNLQVYDSTQKRTLGEYDFIVEDKQRDCHYHIEVAVKFYICLPELTVDIPANTPFNNWHHWVGPNLRDTMAIKMRHLLNHQLVMSHTSDGFDALKSTLPTIKSRDLHATATDIEQPSPDIRLLMTGRLYQPWQIPSTSDQKQNSRDLHNPLPDQLNAMHTDTGCWLQLDQLQEQQQHFFTIDETLYFFLPRQLWMAPITPNDAQMAALKSYSRQELIAELTTRSSQKPAEGSLQHYHIAECTSDDNWQEIRRFFVLD